MYVLEFLNNNFISEFFVLCLNGLYFLFQNYALSIVLLTVLIRLAVLPLDLKQRNNQSKMQALGPQIQSLQKRYANNPQMIQKKQKELYAKMNVRPMLGCIQALIQLPIWFAFFGAMRVLQSEQTIGLMLDAAQNGVANAQITDFFWVHNFWQPDTGMAPILPEPMDFLSFVQSNKSYISPQSLTLLQNQGLLTFTDGVMNINTDIYTTMKQGIIEANGVAYVNGQPEFNNGWFILPAMAGIALFLQQKFSPASSSAMGAGSMTAMGVDPAATGGTAQQAQPGGKFMMWFMPIFSVIICLTSNSAFALYWFTSSMYAFLQMRVIELVKKLRGKGKEKEIVIKS